MKFYKFKFIYDVFAKNKVIAVIISITLVSCVDLFEENISDASIDIVSPSDSSVLNNQNVTLLWNEVFGVSKYQIQMVTPDFKSADAVIFDTLIDDTSLKVELYQGNFQWRLKGTNSAYQSDFQTYSFSIDTISDNKI
ncbi:hypothetical protein [Saccharicrinis aurantiacus]|uniref:hypothetical protein n=1 Tax=Saccharicrinis aurantiacus TaxID=1849719 RepID=UPI00094FF3E6|nr:hypothetical protein [Saccharicrinis aurantiacus]